MSAEPNLLITSPETDQAQLLQALMAFRRGDFTVRLPVDGAGMHGKIADAFNDIIAMNQWMAESIGRVSKAVGQEGRLTQRSPMPPAMGGWADTVQAVNDLIDDLARPTTEMAVVIGAVANGDLSKKITADVRGDMLQLKNIINVMVDQLDAFASEVSRVAREVGTEGRLGGQAQVRGMSGIWKDVTDNVNSMASNLTGQVRSIAAVTTAVARGDLSKKITVDVKGEILELKDTINVMVDQLSAFAAEVTRVAREVGTEGRLGGQANVPGASGTWKDLTENVNQLAANLTTQVRAITDVATAVTRGDLSRSIQVRARGEVSHLKDNINEMIRNLKETTQKNARQDWLKTNLTRFTRLLQGQRDLGTMSALILSELAPLVSAHHGVFYLLDDQGRDARLHLIAGYGYRVANGMADTLALGQGLVGQCALEKNRIWLKQVPRDYVQVSSGLGSAPPASIVVMPILFEQQVKAVIEIGSLERFTDTHLSFLDQLMESIGVVLHTIEANSRTESLLSQSQSLAQELQQTNMELAEKARLLSEQNIEVERKNREVEQAKLALEDKATQLALSSKYKSEFLANMSHELRTPLNSLLILAQQLADNPEGNLKPRQVEFARTIHASGSDLLTLINDILDLSKIESGTVTLEMAQYPLADLRTYVERTFGHIADMKHLAFSVDLAAGLQPTIATDIVRLQQILKNLLANAFKFTARGKVTLSVAHARSGWTPGHAGLSRADAVLAFSVSDTGVGIAADKLQLIFEAFQQADGSTARKYGGTGLGLSISRELARLLDGEIQVRSEVGAGSTFTLYLPQRLMHGPALLIQTDEASPSVAVPDTLPAETILMDARPSLLIVEDDATQRDAICALMSQPGVRVVAVESGSQALQALQSAPFDCMVFDLNLPDIDGYDLLDMIAREEHLRGLPVVIHTATEIDKEQAARLQTLVKTIVIKDARSPARLLEATSRLLGLSHDSDDMPKQLMSPGMEKIENLHGLAGRQVLIIDDDLRNIFALSSVLERHQMRVLFAENGREGIELLESGATVDIVLMDVMMPEMDGYDTTRAIRRVERFETLPIIMLTAKAMKGDREKCLAAGASDYITKPVDVNQLLLLMKKWSNT
ncbi:response regulator [Noviherbaspirillum sp. L7-7A]|uniref:response regulator n=1 Tax=Noviherbaspirillum sp. L7-7A TaxID=2850560 RepID=UPI0020111D41|nr:response regulator [Noviherbaspirillum sp. L7-7A]